MRLTLSAVALFVALGMVTVGIPADAKRQTTSGNVTYKPAGEATLKYSDGVVVHRHSDGSVEVTDPEEVHPLYPSQSTTTRRVVHKRVAKKAAAVQKTSTAKKTK